MAQRQWGAFGFAARRGYANRQPGADAPIGNLASLRPSKENEP